MQKDRTLPQETEQEQEEVFNNVVELKLITGGKDSGPKDPTGNFMADMEIGTIFLVKDKTNAKDFSLGQFQLVDKTDKSCLIAQTLNGKMLAFVDPVWFCSKYQLWEVLAIIKEEETQLEEVTTNESDRV